MKKKGLSILLAAMLLAAVMIPTLAMAQAGDTMYVATANGGKLNVRQDPNPNAPVVYQLPYGTAVTIELSVALPSSDWTAVSTKIGGKEVGGFVMVKYLSSTKPKNIVPTESANPAKEAVNITELNNIYAGMKPVQSGTTVTVMLSKPSGYGALRWAPSKASRLVEKLEDGTVLTVLAQAANWYQVMTEDGKVGFIYRTYVQ